VGETAHRDIAQLTQSNDMLMAASTHLASNVRQAMDTVEGMAGIINPHPASWGVYSLIGSKGV